MAIYEIQLPDGRTTEVEAPEGTARAQVLQYVQQQWESGAFAPQEPQGVESVSYWGGRPENVKFDAPEPSTVGGMVGATVGGTVAGPAGAIAGGAGGSMLGQAYEEYQKPGEMSFDNYWNIVQEGLISVGVDAATLGAGKIATPLMLKVIESYRAAGKSPQEAAKEIAELGEEEAYRRTQKLLSDAGATLTPMQFPNMSKSETIKEAFGKAGIISGRRFTENSARVNDVVNTEFNKLFDPKFSATNEDLGGSIYQIITEGKKQLGNSYRIGLDEVQGSLRSIQVSGKPAANRLKAYRNSLITDVRLVEKKVSKDVTVGIGDKAKTKTIVSRKQVPEKFYGTTDADTLKIMDDAIKDLDKVSEMNAATLIDMQKNMMTMIERRGTFGDPLYNPKAAADLAEFSKVYREAIQSSIEAANPQAAKALKELNTQFSDGLNQLIPPINKGFMTRAGNGSVDALGKIMVSQGQNLNAKNLLNSVRFAFREAAKDPKALAAMPYKTEQEAIDAVRSSYIKELMPKIDSGLDIKDYKNLADKFTNKNRRAKAKEILGDKFVPFMDLLNVMSHASTTASSSTIPSLIIRSKEYQAAGLAMGAVTTAGAVGTVGAVPAAVGALAIFGLPEILAKAATNPKHVNRIKNFAKTNFDTAAEMMEKFSLIANDIMATELSNYTMNESGTF